MVAVVQTGSVSVLVTRGCAVVVTMVSSAISIVCVSFRH